MEIIERLRESSPRLAALAERRALQLETECGRTGTAPRDARLVVMWGGGKDSTLALVLSAVVSNLVGCSVRAVTMLHPGLTPGTLGNIRRLVSGLGVKHEWRQFLRIVPNPTEEHFRVWRSLYRSLAQSTALHPRFICVACNFGSVVTEYKAMVDARAHFRVTGNSSDELIKFDGWATSLKRQFAACVTFPDVTGHSLLDYYRLWWPVYDKLLAELSEDMDASEYLFELPTEQDPVRWATFFSVLEDESIKFAPAEHSHVLESFGWQLPEDIQGGTESDCAMPAVISKLDIERFGTATHLSHLKHAAETLSPLPAMYNRAVSWVHSGKSVTEGDRLLARIGIVDRPVPHCAANREKSMARALVEQLLPVR